jgi:DNA-binding NarL/FixJ family response regulator
MLRSGGATEVPGLLLDGDDTRPDVAYPRVERCARTGRDAMQQPPSDRDESTLTADVLTPREREIAALVAEGLSNAEIAERLVLSPGTVGNHLGHILRALGARNRVQVAVWAVKHGLQRRGDDTI